MTSKNKIGSSDPPDITQSRSQSRSMLKRIGKKIRQLWSTRKLADVDEDDKAFVKVTIRELIVYCCFLLFVTIATYGMTDHQMTNVSSEVTTLFMTPDEGPAFLSIASMADVWKYIEGPLVDGLYWNSSKNIMGREGFVLYENRILGVTRLRQLRIRDTDCVKDQLSELMHEMHNCYGSYSQRKEDKSGIEELYPNNLTAWNYYSEDDLGGSGHSGLLTKYGGGGYVQNLALNRTDTEEIIRILKEHTWIDRETRALFIDFTLYNSNNNIFVSVRLLVEFPSTGGALPSSIIRTVKLIRYVESWDYFIMFTEIFFAMFILYYIIEEILEVKKLGLRYVFSIAALVDFLIIIIALCTFAFNIYRAVEVIQKLDSLFENPEAFADFEPLAFWTSVFNKATACMVFIAWIKVLGFMNFNQVLLELSRTLQDCIWDLFSFMILFFTLFVTFSHVGYLLFGRKTESFSSLQISFFTLFRIMLGDINFYELEEANRILGPPYFFLFIIIVFFVMLNMFLAIINETYNDVKEGGVAMNKNNLVNYLKAGYGTVINRLRPHRVVDIKTKLAENKANAVMEEWRRKLKSQGYAGAEIDVTIENHAEEEIDEDTLDTKASQENDKDENAQDPVIESTSKMDGDPDEDDKQDDEENQTQIFECVKVRVGKLELLVGGVDIKLDDVLEKMEAIEQERLGNLRALGDTLGVIKMEDGVIEEKREQFEELLCDELDLWNG